MTENTVTPDIEMCDYIGPVTGKRCNRPKHGPSALHIVSGEPISNGALRQAEDGTWWLHADGMNEPVQVPAPTEQDPSEKGLVTMLLPTDALRALQEAWERLDDDQMRSESVRLIRDLFDGQDGHLVAIDTVLGPRS